MSVGFIWSTLAGYLAPLVSAAADRPDQLDLSVTQLRFVEQIAALRRGDVDLLVTRALGADTEFVQTTLNRERSYLAVPAAHPLADRETISIGALHGASVVALDPDAIPGAFEAGRRRLLEQGVVPTSVHLAGSPSEALALVAGGVGIYCWMPGTAILPHAGVVYRELEQVTMRTLLVRRPEPPPPGVAAVANLITGLFSDASGAFDDVVGGLEMSATAG